MNCELIKLLRRFHIAKCENTLSAHSLKFSSKVTWTGFRKGFLFKECACKKGIPVIVAVYLKYLLKLRYKSVYYLQRKLEAEDLCHYWD